MSRALAVVPLKSLVWAKGRLASVLDPGRRAALVLWMLERVLRAARACPAVSQVVVLSSDAVLARFAQAHAAQWEPDQVGELNASLEAFRAAVPSQAARSDRRADPWPGVRSTAHGRNLEPLSPLLLVLAGDLPMLTAADVAGLVQAAHGGRLVLGAAQRGGTNALVLPAGSDFAFQFGPNSFARHARQASERGMTWTVFERPGVASDVDLPEDLAWLEGCQPDLWSEVAGLSHWLAGHAAGDAALVALRTAASPHCAWPGASR